MKEKCFPKVTVVINTCGGNEYLNDTLSSAVKVSNIDEIFCVDNGTNNRSTKNIVNKYSNIIYLKSPYKKSKNRSVNYAINRVKGEYLLLLDDDIIIENPKFLINDLLKIQNERIGLISLALANKGENKTGLYGGILNYRFIKDNKKLEVKKLRNLNGQRISFPNGAAFFMKREVWNLLGGYDEMYMLGGDDTDIGIKIWMQNMECILYSKVLQTHIGLKKRDDVGYYARSFGFKLFAHMGVIFKSYSKYMPFVLLYYSCFQFLKAIKQSIRLRNFMVIKYYFFGLADFLKNLKNIYKDRLDRQAWRKVKMDKFILKDT